MHRPGIFYTDDFLKHDYSGHIECKERLELTVSRLKNGPLSERLQYISPMAASAEDLEAVHSPSYVHRTLNFGEGMLDADTYMSDGSAVAALKAAGAATEGVKEALAGRGLSVALVRPPGHHALPDRAMGFCIFNNAAVGAAYALKSVKRAMIVDWDVHHGNGTERMFYDRPDVLYFSVHEYPHFPGTGRAEDAGRGEGEGFNVNVPLPAGSTDADYVRTFEEILLPIMGSYRPDLVILSAGYDPHYADPLGDMRVTEAGFYRLASLVKEGAKKANIVALLEGGYSLEHLPLCVEASLLGFMGEPYDGKMNEENTVKASGWIQSARGIQKKYWRL